MWFDRQLGIPIPSTKHSAMQIGSDHFAARLVKKLTKLKHGLLLLV